MVDHPHMRFNWSKLAAAILLGGVFLPLAWWQGGVIADGTSPSPEPAIRLRTGDCLSAEQGATLTGARKVPCDTPHGYEVFGTGRITQTTAYDGSVLAREADQICIGLFRQYTGRPLAESDLNATHVTPSADSWETGDRGVVCLAADPEGPATGSIRGS